MISHCCLLYISRLPVLADDRTILVMIHFWSDKGSSLTPTGQQMWNGFYLKTVSFKMHVFLSTCSWCRSHCRGIVFWL